MTARTRVLQLAIFLGVFFLCGSQEDGEVSKKKLYVAVLVPLPDSRPTFKISWPGGPAVAPAAIVAAELINNRTDILPGYELVLLVKDSGCNIVSKTEIAFADSIFHSGVNVVGVVGPGCTASTLRTATLAARDSVSIIQIAATATSPELIDAAYSTTYRPVSSQNAHMDTFVKLLEHNYWRRVATLYDGVRNLFFATHRRFTETVPSDCNIVFTSPVFENPLNSSQITLLPLEEIKNLKVRVIYVFTTNGFSGKILCLAHHLNMTYPTYQFLFHGRTLNKVIKQRRFIYDGRRFECSQDVMDKMSEGIINTEYLLERADKNTMSTVSGLSYYDYYNNFYVPERDAFLDSRLLTLDDGITNTTYSNLYHDSVWALALALNSSIPLLEERGMKLENYSYGQREATDIIQQQLLQVDFEGMVGRVTMQNDTRESLTVINIIQMQLNRDNYNRVKIGFYYNFDNFSIEESGMFINDSFKTVSVSVHLGAGIVSLSVTAIGLILSGWLQMMNILHSNIRRVKATSPNLNHLIFSGCYMFIIAAAVYAIQESFSFVSPLPDGVLCNVFTWCVIMGYSLIFGTVCAKMWRIYTIFNHSRTLKSKRRPGILATDQALAIFVTSLLILDTAICIVWTWTDPWVLETEEYFDVNNAIPVIELQMNCDCQHLIRWIAIVASYKGTVATVIIGLSILNRRIHRKEFQHSKHVTVLVYVLILLNCVGIPLFFILGNLNIHITFFILSVILNATVILCSLMLFLPPLLPLLRAKLQNFPLVTCYRKWTGEYA